jgi:hypothetical protein
MGMYKDLTITMFPEALLKIVASSELFKFQQ